MAEKALLLGTSDCEIEQKGMKMKLHVFSEQFTRAKEFPRNPDAMAKPSARILFSSGAMDSGLRACCVTSAFGFSWGAEAQLIALAPKSKGLPGCYVDRVELIF